MRTMNWSWAELQETPEDVLRFIDALDAKAAEIAKARAPKT